jgi:Ca2+-binding RTX toxin-like protein
VTFVKSTIIANPLGGGRNCTANTGNLPGFIASGGFNLESADTCGFGPSDKKNTNPQLGALADNGGLTRTMALPITSPAVDAGVSTGGPNDQRDKPRAFDHAGAPNAPGGNGSDIGAFELQTMRLLSVTTTGSGTGTVSSAPAAIDCGATCERSLEDRAAITLTATPGANTQPAQWSGCDLVNGANECVVAMTSAKNVTATFNLVRRTLTVTKTGSGSGRVSSSPAAIDCGAICAANLDHGTAVTLAGTPATGSQPAQWSGCDSVSGANECVVAMTAAKDVTATFDSVPPSGFGNPPALSGATKTSGPALLPGACANEVLGGAAANRLTGTTAGDKLVGGKANDTLTGLAGDDCLDGREGDDKLDGGDGNDKLTGGKGKDRLDGGAGNDTLIGGPDKNTYSAGTGNDSVNAANKIVETVNCGAGRDSATVDKKDKVRGCERVKRR